MENGTTNFTPVSNRGVGRTTQNALSSCVDWFSCTFHSAQNWQEVASILNLSERLFTVTNRSLNGYLNCAEFARVQIFFDGRSGMGIWLNMSGQGCRDFEETFQESGWSWVDFFGMLQNFNVNITRLDLAIDDFKGIFNLKQIENCIKRGCVTSLFRTARNFEEHLLSDGSTNGQTIYFGKSEVIIRFYDKYKERINKGYALNQEISQWVRTEIQLRGERANIAVETIVNKGYALGEFICGVLNRYLCFRVKGNEDTNKSRWGICRWWVNFLNGVEKISLSSVAPDRSVLKTKDWVDTQVSGSIATLYEAFGDDNLFIDYLIKTGRSKMSKNQKEMAENFKMNLSQLITLKEEMRNEIGSLNYDYVKDVYVDPVELEANKKISGIVQEYKLKNEALNKLIQENLRLKRELLEKSNVM